MNERPCVAAAAASSLASHNSHKSTVLPILVMPADVTQLEMARVFPTVAMAGELGCAVLVARSAAAGAVHVARLTPLTTRDL